MRRIGIRARLGIAFLVAALSPLLITLGVLFVCANHFQLLNIGKSFEDLASQSAETLTRKIESEMGRIEALSYLDCVKEALKPDSWTANSGVAKNPAEATCKLFRNIWSGSDSLMFIVLRNAAGKPVVRFGSSGVEERMRPTSFAQSDSNSRFITVIGVDSGERPFVDLVATIQSNNNSAAKLRGRIHARYDMTGWLESSSERLTKRGISIKLVDSEGRTISSTEGGKTADSEKERLPLAVEGLSGWAVSRQFGGLLNAYGWVRLPGDEQTNESRWYLLLSQSRWASLAGIYQLTLFGLGAALFSCGVGLGLAWFIGHYEFVRPVERLQHAAKQIESADLFLRLELYNQAINAIPYTPISSEERKTIFGNDELGDLADQFNRMSRRLHKTFRNALRLPENQVSSSSQLKKSIMRNEKVSVENILNPETTKWRSRETVSADETPTFRQPSSPSGS
jgi:hypothetical protein